MPGRFILSWGKGDMGVDLRSWNWKEWIVRVLVECGEWFGFHVVVNKN